MPLRVKKSENFNLKMMLQWGRKHFIINPEYQRSRMWPEKKKQLLLDSIIQGLPIGNFILKKNSDGTFEVLDGQQRIDAIFLFAEGDLITSPETKGFREKKYTDLLKDPIKSADFDNFKVFYDEIEDGSDQEIAMIFLRLQEGVPLNSAERLNATIGSMRDFCFKLSRHAVFNNCKIGSFRFAHRLIAAQIILLSLDSDFDHIPYPEFPNLRFPDLKKMYKDWEVSLPPGLNNRVYGPMDTINSILGTDARVIRKKSDLPLVFLLTKYLREKFVLDFRILKTFLIQFFTHLALVKVPDGEVPMDSYERYVELRKKGLTHDTFTERFRIILSIFLSEAPKLVPRDPKRSFEVGQKLAIYYIKNDQICQYCNQFVDWNEADFHHVVFYSKGGPTTVENGQLMHLDCHRKFHEDNEKDK